nr:MAG: hypothetical protein [Bacteriophage sp.]
MLTRGLWCALFGMLIFCSPSKQNWMGYTAHIAILENRRGNHYCSGALDCAGNMRMYQ